MKTPALLLALMMSVQAGYVSTANSTEASVSWRFLELHVTPKPAALTPPPQNAALRAACGDINGAVWQCAEASPALKKYRTALQTRRRALESALDRMAQFPQSSDGTDFQLVLAQSGLARNQIPPALMRKIKTTRFIVAWQGNRRDRPREPYFPY